MDVEMVEFVVPVENNKTLFVWNLQSLLTEAQIYDRLFGVFSSFGPLYLLKVRPNAPLQPSGFSAIVKFFSASHSSKAQRQTDGRLLFQDVPLKVRLSSKHTPHFLSDSSRPLSHARCLELANHCLGFNGWTYNIITLKELSDEAEEGGGGAEEGGGGAEEGGVRRLRFGCLLQLNFPRHGQTTRGAAVVNDSFTCTGPEVLLHKRCKLQKLVRDKALVQAFNTVLLILLENGKVMVEVKQTSDQILPENIEGVVHVNEFDLDEDEGEDEEWDLTVS
ncbi:RAD52 motif-containing protein 1 [Limanda limanda]|uniref:RAD52 motif-containing protein 1 n=1 Tax=Limanda limanda TaxID=27771 RepID=UPI0029C94C60|nr:RAD52 motif-containing protein 1 [Limanda limanda]XP_060946017.1 RAD52 motif-containing protein 1 [Limanda limanda]XP_060946018.1 RAD52 motif-containing protein 1 [Limanda limanda]XP_060946020.1 RAD52 motif-containing protein 1 [Limanda limanda]XP_060946021.1 RAD52 motif-containing protein 1 [Limanda limanda]XP_060946022.1 RAD52 motif-containing protein 1 [Limanda limanda]